MYGTRNVVYGHGVCQFCGNYGKHKSYNGRKWGHLYFIPLIPSGPQTRVLKESASCNMGSHIPEDKIDDLYEDLQIGISACIQAAAAQQQLFVHPDSGDECGTALYLTEAVDLLYTAGFKEEIEGVLDQLNTPQTSFEYAVTCAAHCEITGEPETAAESLASAAQIRQTRLSHPTRLARCIYD